MLTLTRTQPQRMSLSHPGKAKDIRSNIATNTTTTDTSHNSINKNLGNVKTTVELPRVHSSPSKLNYLNTTNEKTEKKIEATESADTKTSTSSAGDTTITESTTETAEPKMARTVAL